MGCDIHDYLEVRRDGTWIYAGDNAFPGNECPTDRHSSFDGIRSYGLFGFLADVRNYAQVPSLPVRGRPTDISPEVAAHLADDYLHSASWATLAELQAVDYGQFTEDRRGEGGVTLPSGQGTVETLGEFLGVWYFDRLKLMAAFGDPEDVRIVFAFDS